MSEVRRRITGKTAPSPEASKEATIRLVYFDEAGFGSQRSTYKDAKKRDPTITVEDVRDWFKKNVERKGKLRGMNSFIASEPREEYQMDLFFPSTESGSKTALIMVDIFTKFTQVVASRSKQIPDVLEAIEECIRKMGGKPKTILSDNEGAFVSNEIQKYFEKEGIRHITVRSHAPVAERQIRTIKDMIDKRTKDNNKEWYEVIHSVLLTYNYKMVHTVTKMTPRDAMDASKPGNQIAAKINMELKARHSRKYEKIEVGSKVKLYRKKKNFEKERTSYWSAATYTVEAIEQSLGQTFYRLKGVDKLAMRSELLLID